MVYFRINHRTIHITSVSTTEIRIHVVIGKKNRHFSSPILISPGSRNSPVLTSSTISNPSTNSPARPPSALYRLVQCQIHGSQVRSRINSNQPVYHKIAANKHKFLRMRRGTSSSVSLFFLYNLRLASINDFSIFLCNIKQAKTLKHFHEGRLNEI